MMAFWIAAALLAGVVAALVMMQAARAGHQAARISRDPAASLYERQLAELDELAALGLLNDIERKAAFSEAARRLLAVPSKVDADLLQRTSPRVVLGAVGAAALAALALYWASGAPGTPDRPFAARLADWRAAAPQTLTAPEMAAVLGSLARERPRDMELLVYLARAQLAAGAPADAAIALRRAAQLSPADPSIQALLGQALVATTEDESVSPEAEAAFRKAAAADPSDLSSRYFLGLAQVSRGDTAAGVAAWRTLRNQMPADDPRGAVLDARIAEATNAAAQTGAQAELIAGMVNRLAERLRTAPDDPEGWARLVHSYGVLGDTKSQRAATADARKALSGRPDAMARFESALKSPR